MSLATVVYGARGSGKTTLGAVIAEEVTRAKQRFCAIDLKGDWYGLKSTADGRSDGIPVVVFGGDHQDVPLEDGSGAFVAETIAGLEQSSIIDLEHFTKGRQIRWLADFQLALYHKNREPLVLLADEAQRYLPQRPMDPDSTRCLGAGEDVVKLGRKHGLGVVLFTQRGSGLNKEVAELCDLLVAFRTPGPLDQERIKDWLDANTTKVQRDEVMGRLSGLPTGTAVFASGHPDLKIFGVHAVRRRETFDSSATPKVGQRRKEPKQLAKPDLEVLREKMSAAIERAKADDPKELRKQLAAARAELAAAKRAAPAPPAAPRAEIRRVEVPILKDGQIKRLEAAQQRAENFLDKLRTPGGPLAHLAQVEEGVRTTLREISAAIGKAKAPEAAPRPAVPSRYIPPERSLSERVSAPKARPQANGHDTSGTGLTPYQQEILDALAWLESIGQNRPTRAAVAFVAKKSHSSSTFERYVSALSRAGLLVAGDGTLRLTEAGRSAAHAPDEAPTVEALQAAVYERVTPYQAKLLRALIRIYPKTLTRDDLADAVQQSSSSSTFERYVSMLSGLGLIEYPERGTIRAHPNLFLDGEGARA
jgi:hypothetical protein